jgi:hypothetical protein
MPTLLPDASALLASLLKLMTRFSCLGCPQQADLIRRELALLQSYPDEQLPPVIKQTARALEQEWQQLHFALSDDRLPGADGLQSLH